MVVPLALMAASLTARSDVPITVDVTSYERVEHALKDGSPDLTAPDNTFARIKYHYVLDVDSDTFPMDSKGDRTVHQNAISFDSYEGYEESGPAPESLSSKFKAVRRLGSGSVERKTGGGTFSELEQTIYKGNRMLAYHVRTTNEQVEIHSEGKLRVTRKWHSTNWSITATVVSDDKPFDVQKADLFAKKASFRVIVDPPIYRFSR